jgi:hypothetical protein
MGRNGFDASRFPKWAAERIIELAPCQISANGQPTSWQRQMVANKIGDNARSCGFRICWN